MPRGPLSSTLNLPCNSTCGLRCAMSLPGLHHALVSSRPPFCSGLSRPYLALSNPLPVTLGRYPLQPPALTCTTLRPISTLPPNLDPTRNSPRLLAARPSRTLMGWRFHPGRPPRARPDSARPRRARRPEATPPALPAGPAIWPPLRPQPRRVPNISAPPSLLSLRAHHNSRYQSHGQAYFGLYPTVNHPRRVGSP